MTRDQKNIIILARDSMITKHGFVKFEPASCAQSCRGEQIRNVHPEAKRHLVSDVFFLAVCKKKHLLANGVVESQS